MMANPDFEHKHTILLVDDEQPVLDMLERIMLGEGYTVLTAQNGAEALDIAEAIQLCLVITDVSMPGMDGFELCRRLKRNRRNAHLPCVLVTGQIAKEDIEQGMAVGAVDYIKKPFDQEELRLRIRSQIHLHQARHCAESLQARLQVISRAANDAIVMIDPAGNITHWNEAAETMFGYSVDEAIGRNLHHLVAPERSHPQSLRGFREFQKTGAGNAVGRTLELIGLRRNGMEFPVELSLSATQLDGQWIAVGIVRDITERKRSEETLRENEAKLRGITDSAQDAILMMDPRGAISYWNSAAAKILGYRVEEAIGRNLHELLAPERFMEAHRAALPEFLRTGQGNAVGKRLELAARRKDGQEIITDLSLSAVSLRGEWHAVGILRDITDRKRMEETLREEREQLEYVLSATRTGINIIDSEFNLHFVDKGWQKVYGDPTGRNCYEYFHGFSEPCRGCGIIKALETKQVVVTEGVLRKENNRPIEARYIPFQDAKGQLFFSVINIDITDRKRSEQALRESEERFMKVLYSSEDAILLIGENKFIECNEATARMLGYPTSEEFLKTHPSELSPPRQPDGRESFEKAEEMMRLAYERGFHRFEWIYRRANGEDFPVEVSVTPIVYQGESLLYCVWRDLTERKQAEAQMLQMELDLRHSQKLEAVGQLAAGIAHEINTPAQFVGDSIGFFKEAHEDICRLVEAYRHVVDAREAGGADQELVAQIRATEEEVDLEYLLTNVPASIERAIDGIGRISSIVRAMKEFAHSDQRHQSPADLNRALSTTLTISRNEYKYIADVETDFGELPDVMCHLGDLNQVFLNLIVNAAHAIADVVGNTNTRGMISIKTRNEGGCVRIDISDTGKGIPEAIRHRVFEPFFTTKSIGKGSGQGLAIARSIVVDKHSGSLTFESAIGQGTTFTIQLPVKAAKNNGEGLLS